MSYAQHAGADLNTAWSYHDGGMSSDQVSDFEEHLAVCAGCREDLDWIREFEAQATDALASAPPMYTLLALTMALGALLLAALVSR